MDQTVAIKLISGGVEQKATPQTWADLGAGSGTFTRALSTLLSSGSTIIAVDTNRQSLNSIALESKEITLIRIEKDFSTTTDLPPLDGILMANALHFISDKVSLLRKLKEHLRPGGKFLLVEYDTDNANQWVPYPISFQSLEILTKSAGLNRPRHLHETPSAYGRAMIYAAEITAHQ